MTHNTKSIYQNRKTRFDVLRFVKRCISDYKIISNGKEISVNCAWCHPKDFKKKLTINAKSGLFHCWRCETKGNFHSFFSKYAPNVKIDNFLLESKVFEQEESTETETEIQYPEYFRFLYETKTTSIRAKEYFDYLFNRGITAEDIAYYHLGYCNEGKYFKRIIVPVYQGDSLVSFIARSILPDAKPKVLTPTSRKGSHGIKDYVFNLDRAKDTNHLIITEGVFDAIKSGISGVCLFGKEATKEQLIHIISVKPRRISIFLDPDAQKYAYKLAKQLLLHIDDIRICCVPEGYDPGSASPEMIKGALANFSRFEDGL